MKRHIASILIGTLLLVACNSSKKAQSLTEPTKTPTNTTLTVVDTEPTPTPIPSSTPSPTSTVKPSLTPTQTPTPVPTRRPTQTPIPSATRFTSTNPLITQLEEQGYVTEPIYRFEQNPSSGATYFSSQGQFGRTNFGGPDFDNPVPLEDLTMQLPSGKTYTYVQYMPPEFTTCELLFFASTDDGDNQLIGHVDIATLNDRISDVVTYLQENPEAGFPPLCLPYGWHDVNKNGKPDMPVLILWGNHYTGGEVHIFEVTDDETIVDLTADLPGPVYHWEFLTDVSSFLVADLAWAKHDCLYPDSPFGFWVYDWDGKSYVDITSEVSLSNYLSYLEDMLKPGSPFIPELQIGPLVSLLLTYDYSGQRDLGWQKFSEIADVQNWPGTDQAALDWLQDDVAHFTREYEAGAPFTPNSTNCPP